MPTEICLACMKKLCMIQRNDELCQECKDGKTYARVIA